VRAERKRATPAVLGGRMCAACGKPGVSDQVDPDRAAPVGDRASLRGLRASANRASPCEKERPRGLRASEIAAPVGDGGVTLAASVGKSRVPVREGAATWAASIGNRGSGRRRRGHVGCERRQIARRRTEKRAEAFSPLRATTTAADPKRASSGLREMSVGPSKYELQGPTV
jgi:hypothetical protein